MSTLGGDVKSCPDANRCAAGGDVGDERESSFESSWAQLSDAVDALVKETSDAGADDEPGDKSRPEGDESECDPREETDEWPRKVYPANSTPWVYPDESADWAVQGSQERNAARNAGPLDGRGRREKRPSTSSGGSVMSMDTNASSCQYSTGIGCRKNARGATNQNYQRFSLFNRLLDDQLDDELLSLDLNILNSSFSLEVHLSKLVAAIIFVLLYVYNRN